MYTKLGPAIAVFSIVALAATPARAQHGGGHGGGGHASGGHGGAGHAGAAVHGGPVGHAVVRALPLPHVNGSTHIVNAPHYPLVHGSLGLYYGSPYDYGYTYGYPYAYGSAYPYGYGGYPYGYQTYAYPSTAYGSVRIQGAPRNAQVYADGYYVGIVDNFDGTFQHLDLEAGPHQIEIRVPGAPPIVFDVNVRPGQTITYRADVRP